MRFVNSIGTLLVLGMLLAFSLPAYADEAKQNDTPKPMYIVPAPKPVTIDGDLSEWDTSGKIGPVSFDDEFADKYNCTFYAMYDKDNLYVAAVIVEPHPPYNNYPYAGRYECCGDEVNIRMSTRPRDPKDFPLQFSDADLWQNATPEIWNGKFWWNNIHQETIWQGYHGMNMCGKIYTKQDLPAGYKAVCKTAADGHGYTMEMEIPWASLNAADTPRPKPGDAIALLFDIIIGTDSPKAPEREWGFEMSGNCAGGDALRNPAAWGKAIFK